MTIDAISAARYLCEKSGWKLTNLQLQKMLYMADMNYVGKLGERLLDEDFEAWDYGPVLPSLYHHCKAFGSKNLPDIFWNAEDIEGTSESEILDAAWKNLKKQPPFKLVSITHSSSGAWVQKYVPGAKQINISTQDMIDEYQRRRAKRTAA